MNQLVFTVWAGAQHGGMMGPAPTQTAKFRPSSGGTVQMTTLQAIGNGGNSANP